MDSIKVTIVIPVYKVEKFISRCLQSILNQTMTKGVECLIIDDCSPDKSMDIVYDQLKKNKSDIEFRIIRNKQNMGIAYVRDLGIIESRGKYLTYIDSDDYCEPDTIEAMYALAEKEDAEMVIADYYVHTDELVTYHKQEVPASWEDRLRANLTDELKGFLWNKLIKKELYTKNKIRYFKNINFGEDFLIALQIFYYVKNVSHLNKACIHYMQDNLNSYSRNISKKSLEDIRKYEKIFLDFMQEKELKVKMQDEITFIRLRNLNQLIFKSKGKLQKEWTNPYKDLCIKDLIKNKSLIPSVYWRIALAAFICGSLPVYNIMRSFWCLLRNKQAKQFTFFQ